MLGWFLHDCARRTFPALVSHGRGKEERGEEAAASSSLVRNCLGVQPSAVGWGVSWRPPPFSPGSLSPESALGSQNPSSTCVVSLGSRCCPWLPRAVLWEGNPGELILCGDGRVSPGPGQNGQGWLLELQSRGNLCPCSPWQLPSLALVAFGKRVGGGQE